MSDLDDLMNIDPLDLTDDEIAQIVAHHRKQRGLQAQGIKPKKEKGPGVSIDHIVNKIVVKATGELPEKPAAPKITRRV